MLKLSPLKLIRLETDVAVVAAMTTLVRMENRRKVNMALDTCAGQWGK